MSSTVTTVVICILIGLMLIALVLPAVIAVIYRKSYNKHANNQLINADTSKKKKTWLPPLGVLLISYGVSFTLFLPALWMIFVAWAVVGGLDASYNSVFTRTDTYPGDADGNAKYGYTLEENDKGNFHYYLYTKKKENTESGSDYILIVDYKGDKEIKSYVQTALFSEVSSDGNIDEFIDCEYNYGEGTRYYADINTAYTPEYEDEAVHTRVIYRLEMLSKDITNPGNAGYEEYCEDTFILEIAE